MSVNGFIFSVLVLIFLQACGEIGPVLNDSCACMYVRRMDTVLCSSFFSFLTGEGHSVVSQLSSRGRQVVC